MPLHNVLEHYCMFSGGVVEQYNQTAHIPTSQSVSSNVSQHELNNTAHGRTVSACSSISFMFLCSQHIYI